MPTKKAYGTTEIAKLCHVTPPTVGRWIAEGKLPYFSTGGGHRRVWAKDLAVYLLRHKLPLPPGLAGAAARRVLIVDDEKEVRAVVRRIAQRALPDFEIHEAADGFAAGHKVTALAPQLVVLDVMLPGIDGVRVCEMIRGLEALAGTKIIAISGHDVEATRARCLAAGADLFFGKPLDAAVLREGIAALAGAVKGAGGAR